MRPADEPSVIAAGAELIARLNRLDARLATQSDPLAGRASVFVGQIHSGEIYNQFPQECRIDGTRRWLPGTDRHEVERDFRDLLAALACDTGTTLDVCYQLVRDAFFLDPDDPFVGALPKCLPGDRGRRFAESARSRSWTTETVSGPWRTSRRSPTAPAPAASIPSRSGHQSMTFCAWRICMP